MKDIKQILMKQADAISHAYTDYNNNPFDPETAHELRISIRVLRGLLNFTKNLLAAEVYQQINGLLRDAALIYGPMREIDVLLELAGEIAHEQPQLSDHYYMMFDYLHKKRKREMLRTFNKTNKQLMEKAIQASYDQLASLTWEISDESQFNWDKYIAKRLMKRYLQLQTAHEAIDLTDYATVHETRKLAKKIRYATKYFGKLTSKKVVTIGQKAEQIQNEFGGFTDAHINRLLLQEFADSVTEPDLKELFIKMSHLQNTAADDKA